MRSLEVLVAPLAIINLKAEAESVRLRLTPLTQSVTSLTLNPLSIASITVFITQ
jgi:hypothetical protein